MLIISLSILSGSVFPLIWDQVLSLQSSLSMESLVKFQSKLTLILEGILPTFLFNAYNDFMVNVDVSMSDMWAAGLSQLSTFIGSAGTVAFALGSAILSFLILLVLLSVLYSGRFVPRPQYQRGYGRPCVHDTG